MGRLLPLLALLDLALLVVALIDCLSTEGQIRALPRVAWVFIILLFPPAGPIVWFVAGRPARTPEPADVLLSGGQRVVAPDDDPDFLRQVDSQRRSEEEEMLRLWEADLRRREDELRDRENKDDDPS
jgi:phospholipase D-like protein